MASKSRSLVSNKTASKKASKPAHKGKQNEAKCKSAVHPLQQFSKNIQVQNMKVFCSMCLLNVVGSEALGHLFFGSLKCTKCFHIIHKCQEFRSDYPSKEKCRNTDGNHIMTQWRPPVWSTFHYNVNKNFVISQHFQDNDASDLSRKARKIIYLKQHLESLLPLKEIEPWKTAFEDPEFKEKMYMFTEGQNPQQTLQENGHQTKPSSSGIIVDKEININKKSILSSSSKECQLQTSEIQIIGTQRIQEVSKRPNTESEISKPHLRPGSSPKKSSILQPSQLNSSSTTQVVPQKEVLKVKDKNMKLKSKKKDNRITFLHTKPSSLSVDTDLQQSTMKHSDQSDKSSSSSITSATHETKTPKLNKEITNDLFPAERKSRFSAERKRRFLAKRKSRLVEKLNIQYRAMLPPNVFRSNHYLLIEYPQQFCPEECPECYFTFTPEMCTVNLCTFMIDLKCPNCNLSVYIVPVKLLSKCNTE